jgi:peptidoglycan/xylan/chitin deacetylase (PgdA/CDA1 family)
VPPRVLRHTARHARDAWEVGRDLLLGRYPEFVLGGPLPKGHVPVFVFHSLEPESFARKLSYLSDNGYVTLSADEYLHVLAGAKPAPERAVVLTFDDGRASVRSVGFPLMRRYGFKGIVFLIPGRIRSQKGALPPTWDDVGSKRVGPEAIFEREDGGDAFLFWEEIDELLRSGLFDFHSHTFSHGRIHTAPQVVGFLTPMHRKGYAPLDVPLLREAGHDLLAPEIPLGTPLLRSEPRTSEALRFLEDPQPRAACVRKVEEEGDGFFDRGGWERELRAVLGRFHGRSESRQERVEAIRQELSASKKIIEERTGRPATHLCYPWHAAGPTARALALEVGYRAAFCGKILGTPITLPGGDPHAVARISEDYLELLPGRGRLSIAHILGRKWSRRRKAGT